MAKKTIIKTVIKKEKVEEKEAGVPTQLGEIKDLWHSLQIREKEIRGLHERIDRIVAALTKSKSVKGL